MKLWRSLLLGLFLAGAIAPKVESQISPDGTTNTTIAPTDNGITIDEGDRSGDNLFHSFEQFSVPNGSEAFFNNPNDIANIFSRVTGGNISNIDGLIKANSDANLFLINPAGIVFGEGAALDIGGSFITSTAESVVFSDDVEFSATDSDNPPLLTINQPIGLNFGNDPGNIAVNNSNLQVDNAKTLAFLGGDVTVTGGQITAPGGNVQLGGVAQAGRVSFEVIENEIDFNFITPETIARADVILSNGAGINVQATGGGSIKIDAHNVGLFGGELGASSIIAGIASESRSRLTRSGDITLNATNNITVDRGSKIVNSVEESAVGNSGGINIMTANLKLTEGGQVNASTFGRGDTGTIVVTTDTIEADGQGQDGFNSGIFNLVQESAVGNSGGINITTADLYLTQDAKVDASTFFGKGDAGEINITTDNLKLTEGGQVNSSTLALGDAGKITIKASGNIEADGEGPDEFSSGILSLVTESATGNSGGIDITTTNLKLTGGAEVNASVLFSSRGDAGKINLEATGTIEADGKGIDTYSSGIFSIVDAVGTGNPGGIDITTTDLKLTGGAEVDASNFFGPRDAGGINITTDNLLLTEGAQINANTSGQGDGGAITITSGIIEADGERQNVDESNRYSSGIFSLVKESAIGNSGGINITTANLKLTGGAEVNASTLFSQRGDAGEIVIKATDTIEADGQGQDGFNSGIFSVVDAVGTGNPGGIDITTANLKLTGGAEVNASTFFGQRDAGGINITTNNLFLTEGGQISASTSGQGNGGAIDIKATDTIEADGSRDGSNSGIFSRPDESAVGNAGGINIDTSNLYLQNNAEISVQSLGQGEAGDLEIQANTVALSNGASLFASTPVGTGGNIDLKIAGNLILQDNSTISAQATENANGGNIAIDANFAIAQFNQNNDIIAVAAEGRGGNIDITTNAIFGLEERSSTPPNNTNDLDASSELGLDGTIEINELDLNPAEALEELPTEVIDVAGLVEQNLCQQGQGSEFIVTGKGGTASSPTQARNGEVSEVDLVKPTNFQRELESESSFVATEARSAIVEARGWIVNHRGMVELVAHKTNLNGSPPQPQVQCHQQ